MLLGFGIFTLPHQISSQEAFVWSSRSEHRSRLEASKVHAAPPRRRGETACPHLVQTSGFTILGFPTESRFNRVSGWCDSEVSRSLASWFVRLQLPFFQGMLLFLFNLFWVITLVPTCPRPGEKSSEPRMRRRASEWDRTSL